MKVKKQGWINIHKWPLTGDRSANGVYNSREEALQWIDYDKDKYPGLDTIQIEWEEEI